jgi:hypothetical protein
LLGPYRKSTEDIFYHFLNKVYDSEERDIKQVLPVYLTEISKILTSRTEMTKGLSRFIKVTPDLSSDYPHLTAYLSSTFIALIDANAINVNEVVWLDPNTPADEAPMIEYFYRLMGEILRLLYARSENWSDVTSFYFGNKLNEKFKALEPLIMEDSLWDSLKEEIPEVGDVIAEILRDNKENLSKLGIST